MNINLHWTTDCHLNSEVSALEYFSLFIQFCSGLRHKDSRD